MKNTQLVLGTIIILSLTAHICQANESISPYIRFDSGYSCVRNFSGGDYQVAGQNSKKYDNSGKSKSAPKINLGVGLNLPISLRSDTTISYQGNYQYKKENQESSKQKFSAVNVMINGYYDFKTSSIFTPYVMAGIGFSRIEAENYTTTRTPPQQTDIFNGKASNNFSWAVGVGAAVKLANNLFVDLNYKYFDMGNTKTAGISKSAITKVDRFETKLRTNEVLIGLRFNLN